jgi:hypothetical protein
MVFGVWVEEKKLGRELEGVLGRSGGEGGR